MKCIQRIISPVLVISLTVLLSACGFQLRGASGVAPELTKITVNGTNQAFQRILIRSLERTGITFSEFAPYTVEVVSVSEDEKIDSTSGGTIITDYSINANVIWQLKDSAGIVLIKPQNVSRVGSYQREIDQFNASLNAKESLVQDLQKEIAESITRRVASLKESDLQAYVLAAEKAARLRQQQLQQQQVPSLIQYN